MEKKSKLTLIVVIIFILSFYGINNVSSNFYKYQIRYIMNKYFNYINSGEADKAKDLVYIPDENYKNKLKLNTFRVDFFKVIEIKKINDDIYFVNSALRYESDLPDTQKVSMII